MGIRYKQMIYDGDFFIHEIIKVFFFLIMFYVSVGASQANLIIFWERS